ncbi:MAG: hypothetical protein LBP67_03865 [Bacteroidales bacterium]|jgi:hypothetical protein|nr:hypothetical protein [Bacteroidales bacterium]
MFGEIVKMKIIVLENGSPTRNEFTLKINPSSLSYSKGISYNKDNKMNSSKNVEKYSNHNSESLNFDFILDSTGIVYSKTETIKDTIDKFEKVVYKYVGSEHEPNEVQICWGTTIFNCHLTSVKYDHSLFGPSGESLRVKVSVTFTNATTRKEEITEANSNSPDLSHCVTLKAGESIAFWCNKIYGDFSYCKDIAEFNGLSNFRNIKSGTKLMFPKLLRHG